MEGWLPFRDVFEVDGQPVRDRRGPAGEAVRRRVVARVRARERAGQSCARAPATTSATCGASSTCRRCRSGSSSRRTRDGSTSARSTRRRSRAGASGWSSTPRSSRPTFIKTPAGDDIVSSGRIWAEPTTGRVHRTLLTASIASITVDYAPRPEVPGLWLPVTMEEQYTRGAKLHQGQGHLREVPAVPGADDRADRAAEEVGWRRASCDVAIVRSSGLRIGRTGWAGPGVLRRGKSLPGWFPGSRRAALAAPAMRPLPHSANLQSDSSDAPDQARFRGRIGHVSCDATMYDDPVPRIPPFDRPATYEDLEKVPDIMVAEIVDDELHASPRPALPHAHVASAFGASIGGPYHYSQRRTRRLVDSHRTGAPLRAERAGPRHGRLAADAAAARPRRRVPVGRTRLGVRGALALHRVARPREEVEDLPLGSRSATPG